MITADSEFTLPKGSFCSFGFRFSKFSLRSGLVDESSLHILSTNFSKNSWFPSEGYPETESCQKETLQIPTYPKK